MEIGELWDFPENHQRGAREKVNHSQSPQLCKPPLACQWRKRQLVKRNKGVITLIYHRCQSTKHSARRQTNDRRRNDSNNMVSWIGQLKWQHQHKKSEKGQATVRGPSHQAEPFVNIFRIVPKPEDANVCPSSLTGGLEPTVNLSSLARSLTRKIRSARQDMKAVIYSPKPMCTLEIRRLSSSLRGQRADFFIVGNKDRMDHLRFAERRYGSCPRLERCLVFKESYKKWKVRLGGHYPWRPFGNGILSKYDAMHQRQKADSIIGSLLDNDGRLKLLFN